MGNTIDLVIQRVKNGYVGHIVVVFHVLHVGIHIVEVVAVLIMQVAMDVSLEVVLTFIDSIYKVVVNIFVTV